MKGAATTLGRFENILCLVERRARTIAPDPVNKAVWSESTAVARFTRARGWIDPSEQLLVNRILSDRPNASVLDIGVGGGRTVPLVSPLAGNYIAIDFIPELVAAAAERFPDADIRWGDARRLDFEDGQFDVVLFSINGLDSIGHDDRALALAEIRRVLAPDGILVFSSHNHDGPGRADRPWRLPPMTIRQPRSSARALVGRIVHSRRAAANYRALHGAGESGPGWAVETSGAHEFGILVHYITCDELTQELRDRGFSGPIEIWDDRAARRVDCADVGGCWYFNVSAQCAPEGNPTPSIDN